MNPIKQLPGYAVHYLGWPVWVVYFRIFWRRSRVLVTCNGEVLLMQGVITKPGQWSLPGGGCKKGETAAASAVRELKEEVGIEASVENLQSLGSQRVRTGVLISFVPEYFWLNLPAKPALTLQLTEVSMAEWVPYQQAAERNIEEDTRTGLRLLASASVKDAIL